MLGGRRTVLEAVRAGRAAAVLVATGARTTPGLRDLLDEAAGAAVPLRRVAGPELDRLAGPNHQGVAAAVTPPPPLGGRDLASRRFGPEALVVVLDGIEDPQNLGASARSAEAAGAEALVEAAGHVVLTIAGELGNFKITTREDLVRAERLLSIPATDEMVT